MTIIKINAITVPADSGDELAERFAARAGAVDDQPGFEGFELLKPTDDRRQWLVVTRWADETAFQAWLESPAFAHGHRSETERGDDASSGHPHGQSGSDAGGHPHGESGKGGGEQPVGVDSEVWSYEIAGGSTG